MYYPGDLLREQGHDVVVRPPEDRDIKLRMDRDRVVEVLDVDADVIVFQRLTHNWMAQAVPLLREQGVAVVVDVDDDLTSIHPNNPSWTALHPRFERTMGRDGKIRWHSWHNLTKACHNATLVTVTTPALLSTYASHGRGVVIPNYLPDHYYGVEHEDSDVIGWPAALMSHPNDPERVGGAISRLVSEGVEFRIVTNPAGCAEAFGLECTPPGLTEDVPVEGWPAAIASMIGIGIAPLADTRFNAAKSWLKPLEMSALGVPWVASPSVEYARLHAEGAGVLADRPRTWYRELRRLVDDPQLRKDRAEAGRVVADRFRMRDHVHKWWDAWTLARRIQDDSPFSD